MRIKAALIDMDGTLYDSMPLHARAWRRLAVEEGWDTPEEEFFMHEGRTGRDTIRIIAGRAVSDDECAELYRRKSTYFRELESPEVMPGAGRMLETLRDMGVQRVLVTGSGQNSLLNRIEIDFPGIFLPGKRVTAYDVAHGKPAPDPYLRGMDIAGCSPEEAIVIENAPLGVESGHASGALTIGVNTGPLGEKCLRDAGADLTFASMECFADALPTLLRDLER